MAMTEQLLLQSTILAMILACAPSVFAQTATKTCNELSADARASSALAYLNQERQNLTTACIVDAIHIIGTESYLAAIPTLVQYLDFKVPETGAIRHSQGPTSDIFPAADALARFGNSAVPYLKDTIVSEADIDKVKRINAAKTLFFVQRHDRPGVIGIIVKASRSIQDSDSANELANLAKDLVRYCDSQQKQQCRDALSSQ